MKLQEFKKLELSITWTLIDIGYKGSKIFQDELSSNEVINYAISLLDYDNYSWEVLELAGEKEVNTEEIDRHIKILSSYEMCNRDVEFEKWVVWYVSKHIQKKYDNYIDGLIELGDIWIKLGMPKDSPHIFQGLNNGISPQKYYTLENYENLYDAHVKWLNDKLLRLRHIDTKY